MKKIITIFAMLCLISSVALAADQEEAGDDYNGDPYDFDVDLKLSGTFTVVGGFVCSVNADYSAKSVVTADRMCWNNKNGGSPGGKGVAHENVVYQVFRAFDNGAKVGEITIGKNNRECIEIPEKNKEYYRQAFYCDEEQDKCRETYPFYTAGCDYDFCNEGEVKRVRGLKDLVTNGCSIEGWKKEVCVPAENFGYTCKKSTKQETANSGDDGSDDSSTQDASTLNGEFQDVGIPSNVEPDKVFEVTARFVANKAGKYYLEAGMLNNRFSVVAEGSKCDNNEHFAGEFVELKESESVDVIFKPKARDKDGRYSVILGSYSGCLNDGGEKLSVFSQTVAVGSEASASSARVAGLLSGSALLGLIFVILIFVLVSMGIYLIWNK